MNRFFGFCITGFSSLLYRSKGNAASIVAVGVVLAVLGSGLVGHARSRQGRSRQGKAMEGRSMQGLALRGAGVELIGLEWQEKHCGDRGPCRAVKYRIVAAEADTSSNTMSRYTGNRDNSDIWLYTVLQTASANPSRSDWTNACGARNARGIFVSGQWHADGSKSTGGVTFSCLDGVIAKCVRAWGYKPWKSLTTRGGKKVDLEPLHQACVRAARADYCGTGVSFTRDGMAIDMVDRHGFNPLEPGDEFSPEAAFDRDGALWIERPRLPGTASCRESAERPASPRSPLVFVWSDPMWKPQP